MLRPFGLDVLEQQVGDRMPPAADCVCDSICSLLSSTGHKWMKTRAVLTESSFFLSSTHDRNLAVHRIPLHEITKIVKTSHDEENRGLNKHKAVAHGTRDKHAKTMDPNALAYYSDTDSEEEVHLLSSTDILQVNTVADGFNFGRIYTLRFKDETTCQEIQKELLVLPPPPPHTHPTQTYTHIHTHTHPHSVSQPLSHSLTHSDDSH